MDLKTLTADKLTTLLNEESVEILVRSYLNKYKDVISWLRYIDFIFDNLSNIVDGKFSYDPDGRYILSDDYRATLHEFAELFPQFVSECVYDDKKLYDLLDSKIKDKNDIYINGGKHRVIFKRESKYYRVCTYDISDPIVNYEIMKFFDDRKVPISIGLCVGEEETNEKV